MLFIHKKSSDILFGGKNTYKVTLTKCAVSKTPTEFMRRSLLLFFFSMSFNAVELVENMTFFS